MGIRVSVIIPAYNAEQYLSECVRSVCDQTLRDIEILIVDDGSKDGTAALADALAAQDGRIRVVHQQNQGPSAARNTGIEAARGEYLGFVDADDRIVPQMYEKLYNCAAALNCEVVTCGIQIMNPDGSLREAVTPACATDTRFDPQQVRQLMPQFVCNGFLPYSVRRLYAARLFRESGVRMDTRFGIGEDTTFCMECLLCADGIAAIPDNLYVYRYVADSLMHAKKYNPNLTAFLTTQYRVKEEICRNYMPQQTEEMHAAIAADTFGHIAVLLLDNLYRKPSGRFAAFCRIARSPVMRNMYRYVPAHKFRSRSLDLVTMRLMRLHLFFAAFCIGKLVFGKDKTK